MSTMRRWLLTMASVLVLVSIGGQCRGSLAQERKLDSLSISCPPEGCESSGDITWLNLRSDKRPLIRTTPMTAAEWTKTYDECVAHLGTPYILAGRHPGISAGVGCLIEP